MATTIFHTDATTISVAENSPTLTGDFKLMIIITDNRVSSLLFQRNQAKYGFMYQLGINYDIIIQQDEIKVLLAPIYEKIILDYIYKKYPDTRTEFNWKSWEIVDEDNNQNSIKSILQTLEDDALDKVKESSNSGYISDWIEFKKRISIQQN